MATESCPTDDQLDTYATRASSGAEDPLIQRHLQECARCQQRLAELEVDDSFVAKVRGAAHEDGGKPDATWNGEETIAAPPSRTPFPVIPGYEILGEIGRGGMGVVYKAIQTPLGREVALKLLPSNLATIRPDAVDRFKREASAASKLHHHNIIPVYDFGAARGAYYYAMELVAGQPLNVLIKRLAEQDATTLSPTGLAAMLSTATHGAVKPPPINGSDDTSADDPANVSGSASTGRGRVYYQQVARWMAEVAAALHYAHRQGVIHRDIKPGNLILALDGRIMLGDFGLAKVADTESFTITGSLIGTWRYMSPEQALAKRMPIDHRTDIYSLGATMYELLVFQPAVQGRDEKEIITQIITKEPLRPRRIIPGVPRELETICLKTLEKAPDARYATAKELADDLRRYIDDLPIVAKRPGAPRRLIKFVKRHKAPVVAACTGVLLVATAGLLVRSTREKRLATARGKTAQVQGLISEARLHAANSEWDLAEAALQKAMETNPDDVGALVSYAQMKVNLFNTLTGSRDTTILEDADALCQKALRLAPEDFTALNTHGVILKKLGRFPEALAAYDRVTELQPEYYPASCNMGTIHALDGDLQAAEQHLRSSTGFATREDRYAVDTWRNLASLQLHLGKIEEARGNIQAALECKRDDMASLLIQARLQLSADPEAAVESAIAARFQAEGREPKVHRILALAHLRTRRFDTAIAHADRATKRGDMLSINHLIRAIAFAGLDDLPSAREEFDQALTTWPDDLRGDGAFRPTADAGALWFETAAELTTLQHEAEALIPSLPSPP